MKHLLLAALAAVCALGGTVAQAQTKVRLGFPAPWGVTPLAYGVQLGFFKEEGLAPEFVSVQGSSVLIPQVANKSIDYGFANPDLPVIALEKAEAYPVRFVYNYYSSQPFEFVVPAASPIQSLADLKGKKLGVGSLGFGNIPMSRVMLKDAGLTWMQDVQVVPVGLGPAAWSRFKSGDVDALNLFAQQHELMIQSGIPIRRLPLPEKFRTLFANGIITHQDTIQSSPRQVESLGRAVAKSFYACAQNAPACAKAAWALNLVPRPAPEKEVDWITQNVAVVKSDMATAVGGQKNDRWGEYDPAAWHRLLQFMKEGGQIQRDDLPLEQLYTSRFVDAYNTWDRAAVKAKALAQQ
ncbi:ABC transporter substrate-binding protein [Xylophilus sp. GW821-FHT01B05]